MSNSQAVQNTTMLSSECVRLKSRTFRVRFLDEVLQLSVIEQLSHGIQNCADFKRLYEPTFGRIKHLECLAHDWNRNIP